MVVCNETVQSFLCGLFFKGFDRTAQGNPLYYKSIEGISNLDKSCLQVFAQEPVTWKREKMLILKIDYLWYGYKKMGDNAIVEGVFNYKTKELYDGSFNLRNNGNCNMTSIIKMVFLGYKGLYKAILQNKKCYLCDKHAKRIGPNITYDSISSFKQPKGHYPYAIAVLNGQTVYLGKDGYPLETQMSYANMRDRVNSDKLGGITMAQYRNLKTIGDSIEPKKNVLTEMFRKRLDESIERALHSVLRKHLKKQQVNL